MLVEVFIEHKMAESYRSLIAFISIFMSFLAGKKGNLTERPLLVGVSLGLSLPAVLGNVFLLIWQTYLLRAELILIIIQLSFIGVEMLLGFIAIILFSRWGRLSFITTPARNLLFLL